MDMRMLRAICAIALAFLLTACGSTGQKPSKDVVQHAIALQLEQTQQLLSEQLRLDTDPAKIQVNRVKIAQQTPLQIQNLQSYRIKGNCDFTVKLPKRAVVQKNAPFEIYLQSQIEGKTWRLAYLKTDDNLSLIHI